MFQRSTDTHNGLCTHTHQIVALALIIVTLKNGCTGDRPALIAWFATWVMILSYQRGAYGAVSMLESCRKGVFIGDNWRN